MVIKRHKPEEITTKLRQVGVLVGQEMARVDTIFQIISRGRRIVSGEGNMAA